MAEQPRQDRGRNADRPHHIPKRGWRDILLRTKSEIDKDQLSLVSAGVAFYALLALFPAIAAAVSIYGLVASPDQVQQHLSVAEQVLPSQARSVIDEQLQRITSGSTGALSLGVVVGLLFALWSATKGTNAMITALNVAYEEEESRGFIRLNLFALGLTLLGIVYVIVSLALIAVIPALLNSLDLSDWLRMLVNWLRWPLLAVVVIFGLAVLYRYAPARRHARWRWVTWGAVVAALLWLLVSGLFSFYVANFGNYNETYGSMGAVVVLLLWLYLSTFVFLMGAELNSEMEHQTARDSTIDGERPMGQRDAYVADHLGRIPE